MVNFTPKLLKSLATNDPGLTSLYLSREGITADQADQLANALERNCRVTCLSLDSNVIGDAGLLPLAKSIGINAALRELSLSYNALTDGWVVELAESLRRNRNLRLLQLNGNDITGYGARLLARSLLHNGALRELNLSYNQVDDGGGEVLAAAVRLSGSLTVLHVHDNPMSASARGGQAALLEAADDVESMTQERADELADELLFDITSPFRLTFQDVGGIGRSASRLGTISRLPLSVYPGTAAGIRKIDGRAGQVRLLRTVYEGAMRRIIRGAEEGGNCMHLILERMGSVLGTREVFGLIRARPDLFTQDLTA